MIDFLDELGNSKQKDFYTSKCKSFLHFTIMDPMSYLKKNEEKKLVHFIEQKGGFNV